MKKFYSLFLVATVALLSFFSNAKVVPCQSVQLLEVINDSTTVVLADFVRSGDDETIIWTLADYHPSPDVNMIIKAHFEFHDGGDAYDQWLGIEGDGPAPITPAMLNTPIASNSPAQCFYFKHYGKFTFTINGYELDYNINSFTVTGEFDPARYLTGEFNNWGETPFYVIDEGYTLTQTFSGEFLIKDQNDVLYGAPEHEPYFYVIQESNPSVLLSSDYGYEHMYLVNESNYTLTLANNGWLTVSGWPVEVITASIVGSTEPGWDVNNATVIPLTLDEATGNYVSEATSIPANFTFKILKHSSLSIEQDLLYGEANQTSVVQDGGGEFSLQTEGHDISFTDNGLFTFTLSPDFSNLKIEGEYNKNKVHYLIGDFNDWNENSMVPFTEDGLTLTLTKEMSGEFLIKDEDGNWLGGATDAGHYQLTGASPSVTLTSDGKKNLYLEFPSTYTFTIDNGVLNVSGFPTRGYFITGDFNNWKPEAMTDNGNGNYSIQKTIAAHDKFKFRDYHGFWYGGDTESNGDTYEIHSDWCTNIDLTEGNQGRDFIINDAGTYNFILTEYIDDFDGTVSQTLTVEGFGVIVFTISLPSSFEHGSIACDKEIAAEGETVTLTVTPDEGYELETLTVTTVDATSGAPLRANVDLTEGENGIYTFAMPAAPVTVNASFKESTPTAVEYLNIDNTNSGQRYNMMGQPVGNDYKGIVIEDGRKILVK